MHQFQGIQLLSKCEINDEVLAHSRNKYSHLIPDGDNKSIEKAVAENKLYALTRKSMVLLTCCILHNIGLNNEEINQCLHESEAERIVENLPFYEH